MQNDYFNKLQGGSSLFMKSDSDGITDGQSRNMPLGIKTVAQGIEHFTDWKGISELLEKRKLSNFEDAQPNKIKFSQPYVPAEDVEHIADYWSSVFGAGNTSVYRIAAPARNPSGSTLDKTFEDFDYRTKEFTDEWSANKVKLLDDLAFVAYDEYTDLHRSDIDLDDITFKQYARTLNSVVSSNVLDSDVNSIGSIVGSTSKINIDESSSVLNYDFPTGRTDDSLDDAFRYGTLSPAPLADYHNSILKVEFNIDGSVVTGYFLYGGAVKNDLNKNFDTATNNPVNTEALKFIDASSRNQRGDFSTCSSHNEMNQREIGGRYFDKSAKFGDDQIWGRFFFVATSTFSSPDGSANSNVAREYFADNYLINQNQNATIQLSIQSNKTIFNHAKTYFEDGQKVDLYSHNISTKSVKLIKIQPVRKCGKVDIYTKKRIIVSSIVDNSITSSAHGLNTNDIVEFSSVLFDGAQNGVADIHPMNGAKYVKVIDADTFEIYDDKFFKESSFTGNIRTTDGITCKCISNNFDSIGQSWDFYKSMFSPTGRNGYKFINPVATGTQKPNTDLTSLGYNDDHLASANEFLTSERLTSIDDETSIEENDASVTLKFDARYRHLVNSDFGKMIDQKIPKSFGDYSSSFDTPLNDPKKSYWDFYPFDCQDSVNKDNASENRLPYWGMRFGCDLDVKFSHMSGNSRVYVLAVGERGSDVSVDLYGIETGKMKLGFPWQRANVIPWSLPHGKTHLFKITVDQFNRISDISHVNTLFGGGRAIVDIDKYSAGSDIDVRKEDHPFAFDLRYRLRNRYINACLTNGAYHGYAGTTPYSNGWYDYIYGQSRFIDSEGRWIADSAYWLRSAVVHWVASDVHDYRIINQSQRDRQYLRKFQAYPQFDSLRVTETISDNTGRNRSRFGSIEFGEDFVPYKRIKSLSGTGYYQTNSESIFPWVDSFGKSVAIKIEKSLRSVSGYSNEDPKVIVLSGSTSRSNIEYTEFPQSLNSVSPSSVEDSRSKIGQIQANFVYSNGSTYENIDFMYLNSDGSDCGRFYNNITLRKHPNDERVRFWDGTLGPFKYVRVLKTGSEAGLGMAEVMNSCRLSASCIEWDGDKVIWVDQELFGNKSTVNILNFDDNLTQCFTKSRSISRPFIDNRVLVNGISPAKNTGDGFGISFKHEGGLFVTNGRSATTELGYNIIDAGALSLFRDIGIYYTLDRLDYLHVYDSSSYQKIQKISATINKMDEERYSFKLLSSADFGYESKLHHINGSVSYDNNAVNTLTWEIDFDNRYDIVNNKILIKDPVEYSLFSRDDVDFEEYQESSNTEIAEMYLAVSENVKYPNSLRSGLNLSYEYLSQEAEYYRCADYGGSYSTTSTSRVPFFFHKLPIENLDYVNSVTIEFDAPQSDIFSQFELNGSSDVTNNIFPRIVLYSKDPRTTIIQNGPADRGSRSVAPYPTAPTYVDGLWNEVPASYQPGSDYYGYTFPGWLRGGAQDLFFYSRSTSPIRVETRLTEGFDSVLAGGSVNLGEFCDSTAGVRANGAGDPVWSALDVGETLPRDQHYYARLFVPEFNGLKFALTIPGDILKDFVIRGDVSRDVDRPNQFFTSFDDTNNKTDVGDIEYTLAIGFVLTNLTSFNGSLFGANQSMTWAEPSNSFNLGPLRYVSYGTDSQAGNVRYPYQKHVNVFTQSANGFLWTGDSIDYKMRANVKNYSVIVDKFTSSNKRYRNKFHKVAVFRYDQDAINDVQEKYIKDYAYLDRDIPVFKSFGVDRFIPIVSDPTSDSVISISRKSAVFDDSNSEAEVLVTVEPSSSNLFIDKETGEITDRINPSGLIGDAHFNQNTLLGGFTFEDSDPKNSSLSLYINNIPTEDNLMDLYQAGHIESSGVATLNIEAFAGKNNNMDLWVGQFIKSNDMDLSIDTPFGRRMGLFIHEVQPSSDMTAFVRAPNADSPMTLTFTKLPSGVMPLNISGPIAINNSIPLVRVPAFSGDMTAYIGGKSLDNNSFDLNVDGVVPVSGNMTLTFSPGVSGSMPLFLTKYPESSGSASLVMVDPFGPLDASIPLKISKNTADGGMDLFIKSPVDYNQDTTLYVNSQEPDSSDADLFINSQVESDSGLDAYIRSIFPSGEMDLVVKPIDRTLNGDMSLHIANAAYVMPMHIEKVLPGDAPLVIGGFAPSHSQGADVFLKGQTSISGISLFVDPIGVDTESINLTIDGSLSAGIVDTAPLFIGKEINANGLISLYTSNDKFARTPGADGAQGSFNLTASGRLSSFDSSTAPMFIGVDHFASGTGAAEMFVKVREPIRSENGNIIESGVSDFVIVGNNDAGVPERGVIGKQGVGMFIANRYSFDSSADLYLYRPEEAVAPLFIRSLTESGNINVYISGANIEYNNMDLYISPPAATGIQFFTRGYLE